MKEMVFQFTFLELLAFLGLAQSVYIIVYIALRSRDSVRAVYPLLFFFTVGGVFFMAVANSKWQLPDVQYNAMTWFFWAFCAPLSSLLAIQMARITKPPPLLFLPSLLYVPAVYYIFSVISERYDVALLDGLYIAGIIIGAVSLLMIWLKRDSLDQLHKRKNGRERFWLIIALITLNILLLAMYFLFLGLPEKTYYLELIRVILGLSVLYVTSTSLFRVYPPIIPISATSDSQEKELSSADIEIATEIETLLHVQKVYQEPSYGRSDMAKELDISESQLSRVVNGYFQKNVPTLLNELRVQEAKMLLIQTKEDIATIAEEVGFNSIATFNRVFKDVVSVSPKEYRQKNT